MAANVAVLQGSSRGIGLAYAQYLLRHTSLNVVGTSRDAKKAREAILGGKDLGKDAEDRLMTVELDVLKEESIVEAAKAVEKKHGKDTLRLLINVSGVLYPEKSILKIDAEEALDSFRINTIGHLLTYKHFVPLLPSKKSSGNDYDESKDPAHGIIKPNLSVLASMSARVGSIGENGKGGWYSYRSSKAAINQSIVSLNHELGMRSAAPSIALALHPGTVAGTDLSERFAPKDQRGSKTGIHGPDEAAEMLLKVISQQGPKDGGRFLNYEGESIPW